MYNLRFLTLRPPKESGGLYLIFFDYSIAFNEVSGSSFYFCFAFNEVSGSRLLT